MWWLPSSAQDETKPSSHPIWSSPCRKVPFFLCRYYHKVLGLYISWKTACGKIGIMMNIRHISAGLFEPQKAPDPNLKYNLEHQRGLDNNLQKFSQTVQLHPKHLKSDWICQFWDKNTCFLTKDHYLYFANLFFIHLKKTAPSDSLTHSIFNALHVGLLWKYLRTISVDLAASKSINYGGPTVLHF